MVLGKSVILPLNEENYIYNRNTIASGKHGYNSVLCCLGRFQGYFFQFSSKYIGDVGGSKKAQILDLAPKITSSILENNPRRVLGDISN